MQAIHAFAGGYIGQPARIDAQGTLVTSMTSGHAITINARNIGNNN